VQEAVARRKPTQYTTALKLLQIMAEKGLVRRNEKQRAHVYEAGRPREWTQRQLAGDLLLRAFGGSAKSLVLGALSAHRTSPEELAEIRKLLDKYEREDRSRKSEVGSRRGTCDNAANGGTDLSRRVEKGEE